MEINLINIPLFNNLKYHWSFIFKIAFVWYTRKLSIGKKIICNNYKMLLCFTLPCTKIHIPSLLQSRYYSRPDNLFNINEKGHRTMGRPLELRPFSLYIHIYIAYTYPSCGKTRNAFI